MSEGFRVGRTSRHDGVQFARPFVFAPCQGPAPLETLGRAALWRMRCDPGSPWVCVRGNMACPPLLRRTLGVCLCVFMYYNVASQ